MDIQTIDDRRKTPSRKVSHLLLQPGHLIINEAHYAYSDDQWRTQESGADKWQNSGVTMGWLLRLVTGAPLVRGPSTVPKFLMINLNVCVCCY